MTAEAEIPPERLVLGGFSQGAVMSYALGLARGAPAPGAILAFSGFVPTVEGFAPDLASRAGLPVSIAHGTLDPIIHVEFGRRARDLLTEGGLDVAYVEEPIPHTIGRPGSRRRAASSARRLAGRPGGAVRDSA